MAPAEWGSPSALCLFNLVEGAPVDLVWGRRGASEGLSLWPVETLGCGEGRVVLEGLALRPMTIPGRGGGRAALETRPAASASSSPWRRTRHLYQGSSQEHTSQPCLSQGDRTGDGPHCRCLDQTSAKKEQQTIKKSEKSGTSHFQKYRTHTIVKTIQQKKKKKKKKKKQQQSKQTILSQTVWTDFQTKSNH